MKCTKHGRGEDLNRGRGHSLHHSPVLGLCVEKLVPQRLSDTPRFISRHAEHRGLCSVDWLICGTIFSSFIEYNSQPVVYPFKVYDSVFLK